METRVQMLSSGGQERLAWLAAWEACGREPFAHPGYVESFCAADDEPRLVHVVTSGGLAIMPVILRAMPGTRASGGGSLLDATSPYGYGGPYREGAASAEFWPGLLRAMEEVGAVSMFGRLALDAPIPETLPVGATLRVDSENVVVDRSRPPDEQWLHYEHKVRKNVKKALRADLGCEVKDAFTDVAEFAAHRGFITGESERLFDRGVTLPSGSALHDDEIGRVLSALRATLAAA